MFAVARSDDTINIYDLIQQRNCLHFTHIFVFPVKLITISLILRVDANVFA